MEQLQSPITGLFHENSYSKKNNKKLTAMGYSVRKIENMRGQNIPVESLADANIPSALFAVVQLSSLFRHLNASVQLYHKDNVGAMILLGAYNYEARAYDQQREVVAYKPMIRLTVSSQEGSYRTTLQGFVEAPGVSVLERNAQAVNDTNKYSPLEMMSMTNIDVFSHVLHELPLFCTELYNAMKELKI